MHGGLTRPHLQTKIACMYCDYKRKMCCVPCLNLFHEWRMDPYICASLFNTIAFFEFLVILEECFACFKGVLNFQYTMYTDFSSFGTTLDTLPLPLGIIPALTLIVLFPFITFFYDLLCFLLN